MSDSRDGSKDKAAIHKLVEDWACAGETSAAFFATIPPPRRYRIDPARTAPVLRTVMIACSLVTTVCCIMYIPSRTNRRSLEKVKRIEVGTTSRDDLLRVLGPPNVFAGETTSVYEWRSRKGTWAILLPAYVGATGEAFEVGPHLFRAMAKFDGQDRLTSFDLETYPFGVRRETGFDSRGVIPRASVVRQSILGRPSIMHALQLAMGISHDGSLVAGSYSDRLDVWSIDTGELALRIRGGRSPTHGMSIAFSPDGRWLAFTRLDHVAVKSRLVVWDLHRSAEALRLKARSDTGKCLNIVSIAFFPDSERIAIGSRTGEIQVLQLPSGEKLLSLPSMTGPVGDIDISPDQSLLAAAGPRGATRILDLREGRVVQTLAGSTQTRRARAIRFSPDGRSLAVSSQAHLEIWDVSGLPNGEPRLQQVALLPILDLKVRSVSSLLVPHLVFSATGNALAVLSDYCVSVWDVASGRLFGPIVGSPPRNPKFGTPIYDAIFTAADCRLLTAEADKIEEWDLAPSVRAKPPAESSGCKDTVLQEHRRGSQSE